MGREPVCATCSRTVPSSAAVVSACSRGMRFGGPGSVKILTEGICADSGPWAYTEKANRGANARKEPSTSGTLRELDELEAGMRLGLPGQGIPRNLRKLHRIRREAATFFAAACG